MPERERVTKSTTSRRNRGVRIKDEVYRQMFRLEEHRHGAEIGLALALLRAWLASDLESERSGEKDWLKKISPICLEMIEAALRVGATVRPCEQ